MAEDTNRNTDRRGWHGDSERHAEAGRKGGEKVAAERGSEFYQEIGSDGGKQSPTKFEKGSQRAKEAGRKGGKASGGNTTDNR